MDFRGIPNLLGCSVDGKDEERIASNVTQLIGWTPLVELRNIMKKDGVETRLVAKLEYYHPLSSVKDRSALGMIEDAEEKGLITPGLTTLIEPTGGNLGIGLTYISVQKGYKFIAVMPAQYSTEKQILLKYLGADIVLTDPGLGYYHGVVSKADELKAEIPNSYILNQFCNSSNPDAHFRGTGPEIWKDTAGKVDILVCCSGSGGTIVGCGRYLKMKNPSLKVIVVEPAESPVISGGNPGKHRIQGMGPGVIPDILDTSLIDEVVTVSAEEAFLNARRLAKEEGLLVGISSGAALSACLKVAAKADNKGSTIVTIFPSGGERYLSTELFSDAREECSRLTY